ncbi:metallophosphoesterase family protein, partial [bacterium]|nr:metallophosphoesterase family protein [bacterium]
KSVKLTQEIIEPESINFLRSLESMKSVFINDIKIKIAHGSPTDLLEGYVYPDSPVNPEDFRTDEEDILILGHTHYQMIKRFKEYQVINPGSCGQPRDGSLHSGYAILDTLTLNVKLYKYPFDTKEMIKTIIKANWPHELIKYFEGSQI